MLLLSWMTGCGRTDQDGRGASSIGLSLALGLCMQACADASSVPAPEPATELDGAPTGSVTGGIIARPEDGLPAEPGVPRVPGTGSQTGGRTTPVPSAGGEPAAPMGSTDAAVAMPERGGETQPPQTSYPPLEASQIPAPHLVAGGFALAESPLWNPCSGQLLFMDVRGGPGRKGVLHSLDAAGKVGTVLAGTDNANGMGYDVDGSLILAQMGGHLGRLRTDGSLETLEPAGSPRLHTPDDVVVRSDGLIYFSDGDFYPLGALLGYLSRLPVYSLAPGASALVEATRVTGPNGIELSPDERWLYVSAYGNDLVMRYAVADDGSLSDDTVLIRGLPNSDSLCLDVAGNLYIGTRAGLAIHRADGERVAMIPLPGGSATTGTTNCTFGGARGRTLFITTYTSVFQVSDMPIPGLDARVASERARCP